MTTRFLQYVFLALVFTQLTACGVNSIPTADEQVKAAWAQVENQYQRRADLIPNLVSTVKAYAKHEKSTLTAVTEARAKVGSIQVTGDLLKNPKAMKQFMAAQGSLGSALQHLMMVSERYPNLKANKNFLTLQAQLEGTENRISVARRDFIKAVQHYNTLLRTFPTRIWHSVLYSDLQMRETYQATANNAEKAPVVNFK